MPFSAPGFSRSPDKGIMIAGDDDHKLENNPGRVKAIEAAQAVGGVAVFPNSSVQQQKEGMTDFNDLARENVRLAKSQLRKRCGVHINKVRNKQPKKEKACSGWIAGPEGVRYHVGSSKKRRIDL